VLLQRVRDAERDLIFNEYKDKKGELIRGIVRRFEKGNNIIVDIGAPRASCPSSEQTPRETYRPGDRIVAYVKDIDREARGPQVILSRSDPRLVEKLFEAEVPEIYEGIVRIVGVAREPGARRRSPSPRAIRTSIRSAPASA
jgi:N utilization substance protein A